MNHPQGGFVGTLRVLPESAPFSVSADGTIRVMNSTALDRETTESFLFQVMWWFHQMDTRGTSDLINKPDHILKCFAVIRHTVKVEARETKPPNHVTMATVNVTLLDENDNSPKFSRSKYESKVFTNQTEGMLIVKVRRWINEVHQNESSVSGNTALDSMLPLNNGNSKGPNVLPCGTPSVLIQDVYTVMGVAVTAHVTKTHGLGILWVFPCFLSLKVNVDVCWCRVTIGALSKRFSEGWCEVSKLDSFRNHLGKNSQHKQQVVFTGVLFSLWCHSQVEAEDPDAGVNGQIKYSIDFGNQNNFFSIDENTGAIKLIKVIPLETHQTLDFLLFIKATDGRCEHPVSMDPFTSARHVEVMRICLL